MRSFILVLILFFANSVYAQEAFVYNDHGKRDPFVPLVSSAGMVVTYDEDLSVNDLVLEGIVADASGNNVAIVNGKIVKAHDQIGPYVPRRGQASPRWHGGRRSNPSRRFPS